MLGLSSDGYLALAIGYALGSIPFGLILTHFGGAGNLRAIGSGNIGATNVLRTGRKGLAAATLLLDMAKGAAAVLIARHISPELALIGGIGAFIGHCYPIWLKFSGGKGVATLLGIALAFDLRVGGIVALAWLAGLAVTRMSSIGGIAAAIAAPVAAYGLTDDRSALMLGGLALIVIWKHQENIKRIFAGTEPKVGAK